ncbi:MAG: PAS domain S-box protein [Thermoflexales bacterium]|nr:PAS domain S-box protein [Thermoflexales bacterium]
MDDSRKTKAQLVAELEALRQRVAEMESSDTACRPSWPADGPVEGGSPPVGQELQYSEALFRALVENATDIICLQDLQGRYVYCHVPPRYNLLAQEAVGKTPYDFFDPDTAGEFMERVRCAMSSGEPQQYESQFIWQGQPIWFDDYVYPVKDAGGQPIAVGVIARDITKRKQAEEALCKSKERYQSFISQSHEAIYCTEFDQPIDISLPLEQQIDAIYQNAYMGECNQAMVAMYGLPSIEALVGQRLIDFHGGQDNPVNRATFRKFIESSYCSVDCETEEVTPQGEKRFFLTNDVGVVENGHLLRIWGTATDITNRKQAEEALRKSEEKYHSLVENIPDVVWTTDENGHTPFISSNIEHVFGYTPTEVIREGDKLWFGQIHPDDCTRVQTAYHDLFVGHTVFDIEYRIRRKDGEWIWLHDRSIQTYEQDGIGYADGIFSDITDKKKTEEKLRESEERYRSLFNGMTEGFALHEILCDDHGVPRWYTRSCVKS